MLLVFSFLPNVCFIYSESQTEAETGMLMLVPLHLCITFYTDFYISFKNTVKYTAIHVCITLLVKFRATGYHSVELWMLVLLVINLLQLYIF